MRACVGTRTVWCASDPPCIISSSPNYRRVVMRREERGGEGAETCNFKLRCIHKMQWASISYMVMYLEALGVKKKKKLLISVERHPVYYAGHFP